VVQTNAANHSSVTDSDGDTADPAANQIAVTLTAGGSSTGNNFLDIADAGSVSGQVRLDVDQDGTTGGITDSDDTGLSGVTVQLFTDPNNDGDPSDGAQVGTSQTTDSSGNYSFSSVVAGNYVIVQTDLANHSSVLDIEGDTTTPSVNRLSVTMSIGGSVSNQNFLDVRNVPQANPDTNTANEGGSAITGNILTGGVATGDNPDDQGDPTASVISASQGGNPITFGTPFVTANGGRLTLNANGSYSYVPPASGNVPAGGLVEVFNYTIADADSDESSSTLTITVNDVPIPPENLLPLAVDDSGTTDENTPITLNLLSNDTAGEPATTIVNLTAPSNGTVLQNTDGTVTYTPNAGFTGVDTFQYVIRDGNGDASTATVTITVVANNLPEAVNDTDTTPIGTPVTTNVLGNDDQGDAPATVESITQPSNGVAVNNADGTVTYTPNPDFTGEDSYTYTIVDDNGDRSTATVTVTVSPNPTPNLLPVAVNDSGSTEQGTPITTNVLGNDNQGDAPATVTQITQASNGTVVNNGDGTVTYTPNPSFSGTDTYTYTITDDNGDQSTATVTVTVVPAPIVPSNQPPIAVDNSASTLPATPVTIAVLPNDSDPDNDPLTVTGFTPPANGSVTQNPDGTFTYTPNAGFTGVDTFTYTISDGNGGTDTATVTVTVPDNLPPDAVNETTFTRPNTPVNIRVLPNDSDPENDPLTIIDFTPPTYGEVALNPDGTFTYVPEQGFTGADTFTYTISDGHGGTDTAIVRVLVESVNQPPVAVDDARTTQPETPVTISVLGNDSDPDGDTLTITHFTTPDNGTVTQNADGTFTYTPDAGFSGEDTFTYTIRDSSGGTDTATVTITVPEANQPPVAVNDRRTTQPETPVIIPVLSNDSDPDGDPLTVTEFEQPANGTVTQNPDGSLTYTPDAGFTGTDTFTYTISDGNGGTDTATVTITVPENQPPVAVDDVRSTLPETPVIIPVLTNDSDPDGDPLTVTEFTQPANGTVTQNPDGTLTYTPDAGFSGEDTFTYTISDGNGGTDTATVTITVSENQPPVAVDDVRSTLPETPVIIPVLTNDSDPDGDPLTVTEFTQPANGTVTQNPDGTLTYTPDAGFTGTDTFTYTISDGNGGTDTATVTIVVAEPEFGSVSGFVLDDVNYDGTGDLGIAGVTVTLLDSDGNEVARTTTNADGQYFFDNIPVGDYSVVETDPSNYDSVSDSDGDANGNNRVAVTVTSNTNVTARFVDVVPNNPPVASDDDTSVRTDENNPVNIPVLPNDSDPDGDPLTVTVFTQPEHGTVVRNPDGSFTYTPDADYIGDDSFTYTITDGKGGYDTATVTLNVLPLNDPPNAVDDTESTRPNQPVGIVVLSNDSDPDGDPLTVTDFTQPSNGSLMLHTDGSFTYTPNSGFTGTDTFTYTITDGRDGTDTATVTITVPEAMADLSLEKTVSTLTPTVGSSLTYFVQVTNAGPDTATGVEITESIPSGLANVSVAVSQGLYDAATGLWIAGEIPVGTVVTLTMTGTVLPTGSLSNTAQITESDQPDIDSEPDNNMPGEDDGDTVVPRIPVIVIPDPEPEVPETGTTPDPVPEVPDTGSTPDPVPEVPDTGSTPDPEPEVPDTDSTTETDPEPEPTPETNPEPEPEEPVSNIVPQPDPMPSFEDAIRDLITTSRHHVEYLDRLDTDSISRDFEHESQYLRLHEDQILSDLPSNQYVHHAVNEDPTAIERQYGNAESQEIVRYGVVKKIDEILRAQDLTAQLLSRLEDEFCIGADSSSNECQALEFEEQLLMADGFLIEQALFLKNINPE